MFRQLGTRQYVFYSIECSATKVFDPLQDCIWSAAPIGQNNFLRFGSHFVIIRSQRGCGLSQRCHFGPKDPRVDDGLRRTVGSDGISRMRGIPHECHTTGRPVGQRITVHHGIFENLLGSFDHFGDIQPIKLPVLKKWKEIFDVGGPVPILTFPPGGRVHPSFGNPVHVCQSCCGVGS